MSLLSVLSNGELPPAVRVNDLSITYRTTLEREPTLKQALIRFGRGQRTVKEIEAIKDVTSQVRTGTAMGIIGSNGSVKSTLMRAMAGILPPTSGSIEVWGRASTLLALGSGSTTTFPGGRTSSWAGWLLGGGACSLGSVACRTAGPAGNFRAGVEGLVREVGVKDNGIATTMLQG